MKKPIAFIIIVLSFACLHTQDNNPQYKLDEIIYSPECEILDDRVLVEETTYEEFEEFQNEEGVTETRWLEPCTQKFIYSKL